MKISFFGTKEWEAKYLEDKISSVMPDTQSVFPEGPLDKDHLPEDREAEVISVFVDHGVSKEVIDSFPNLKMIATRSTGFDHIDTAYCKEKGIVVSSVPSYGENTVAEFAFTLILALARKLFPAVDNIKETGKYSYEGLMGFDLKGKTLGVVGTGRIGRHVIKMAKGFDMRVIAYDAFPNDDFAKELGFEYMPFDNLLAESDVVTIHVPFMKETEHMFNKDSIVKMKKGAVIVNTARGPVVETKALVEALQSGHLGGAGLDVLEEEGVLKDELGAYIHGTMDGHNLETVIANHVLIDMPNVLITPHAAFNTKEAVMRILDTTSENIKAFVDGNPMNVVK